MQVVSPIDIEDELRSDLHSIDATHRYFAPPIPPDLKAGDVLVTSLGGARVSGASSKYDVSIDCYASDYADAAELADSVHGIVSSLPLRSTSTQYSDVTANLPYQNFDPRAANLARYTFRATLTCPGLRLNF